MKEYLSDRINNLAVSQTLAMAAKARELKNEGKDVIGWLVLILPIQSATL